MLISEFPGKKMFIVLHLFAERVIFLSEPLRSTYSGRRPSTNREYKNLSQGLPQIRKS